jgi:phytoene dehydrogenase-like protein
VAPLTCAALLAKRGFRVAVLGQQTDRPDYAVGRFRLPRHPFTLTANHAPLARRIFAELGLGQSLRRLTQPLSASFQVAMPGHRFEIPADEAELDREIEREFPEVKRSILEFRRRIEERAAATDKLFERDMTWPPDSLLERRELNKLAAGLGRGERGGDDKPLSEFPDAHPFRLAVLAPIAFSAHTDPASITELQLSRLFNARWRDAMALTGGLAALNDLLVDKIRAHSGQLRFRERAQHVLVKRGAACGVRLFGSDEEIGAATVIAGVDVASLQRLLHDRSPLEGMFERLGEPQPRFYRYTLNVVVQNAGVPVGMQRDVFYVRDTDKALSSENLLHVELSRLDADHSLVCAEALLPARSVEDRDSTFDDERERVMSTLSELIPFLDRHLVLIDSPHDGKKPWSRDPNADLTTAAFERRGPHTMPIVHAFPVTTALSVCAMPVKTPLRGLLLCSQQVAPGLGVEGELLAASSAAHVVRRADRGREWLRRRLWTKVEI